VLAARDTTVARPSSGTPKRAAMPGGSRRLIQRIGERARIMAKATMDDARKEPSARVAAI
jgi:hypothetical protein